MPDGYNFARLKDEILKLSHAKVWEVARKEWTLVDIFELEEPGRCLCGHTPIIEVCELKNLFTQNQAEVGNRCVKRFLGFRTDLIFNSLKNIREDVERSLNADAAAFFFKRGFMNEWEYEFVQDNLRKKILTPKQFKKRIAINQKILKSVARRGIQ